MIKRTALPRTSLHDLLVTEIREMIEQGDLKPGEKISEPDLCQRFDVSRTPLREALKVLAFEGLVQLRPRRGVVVSSVAAEDVSELFPIMGAIEALAGKLVCQQGSEESVIELRSIHNEMEKFYADGDEEAYQRWNRTFHETLVRASGNQTLEQIYGQLVAKIRFSRFVVGKTEEQWTRAMLDHREVIQALERKAADEVSQLLDSHVTGVAAEIARSKVDSGEVKRRNP